jgi:polyvinyl alcohol dehydrogenase (cytochrome)
MRLFALALVMAVAAAGVWSVSAREPHRKSRWTMIGHDIRNTRSQPLEEEIGVTNVAQLEAKWVFTTFGDVSATPAVSRGVGDDDDGDDNDDDRDHDRRHGHRAERRAVFFPDWGGTGRIGGTLWKLDAETGAVLWSNAISTYNGITGSISRTSPVLAHGMVFVGDLNGNMMGVDAATGNLRWITRLDQNPATIVTTSPIIHGDRLYIGTSSNESAYARAHPGYVCCKFRGSVSALDAHTGRVVWQSFVLPDNEGHPDRFAGGAFVNPPAIDLERGLVYAGSGNLYTEPASVTACLNSAPNGWSESCFPSDARFNSVVAFDIHTGNPRWSFRGSGFDAWQLACGNQPPSVTWCASPAIGDATGRQFAVWDFAGAGANVFTARVNGQGGRRRDLVGIGQKTGIYWVLDAATGKYVYSSLVGPGSDPGGIQWGTAFDGRRIYAAIGHNTGQPYALPSGQVITGGSWAALDPSTGRILWQTADPTGAPDLAALTIANGVLYAGSMQHVGEQLYALDAATGAILWRFVAGGSVVSGPAVVDGTVYWGTGYARTGGVGNNKFYAFTIDGK